MTVKQQVRQGHASMLPPLRFTPLIKHLRWGGTRLGDRLGKSIGSATDAAESWEVVDHGSVQSIVSTGPHVGRTLASLMSEFPADLLGCQTKQTSFPLLVKFLDAHDRLSLQVHPTDVQAQKLQAGCRGKTEAWVILEALPGSLIYAGLRPGIDRRTIEAAVQSGTLVDCVHAFEARVGDSFLIPAGTVHAVGEGVLLAEFQQTSDITFRLYDWDRVGPDGQPRPLHIDAAVDSIDFTHGPVAPLIPRLIRGDSDNIVEELVSCEHFALRRHTGPCPWRLNPQGRFRILMMLEGSAILQWDEGSESLKAGDTTLIPASCPDCQVIPAGPVTMLEAGLPTG